MNKTTNILIAVIAVMIGVIGFFTITEERLCESSGYPHALHQLTNFQGDNTIKHRYLK